MTSHEQLSIPEGPLTFEDQLQRDIAAIHLSPDDIRHIPQIPGHAESVWRIAYDERGQEIIAGNLVPIFKLPLSDPESFKTDQENRTPQQQKQIMEAGIAFFETQETGRVVENAISAANEPTHYRAVTRILLDQFPTLHATSSRYKVSPAHMASKALVRRLLAPGANTAELTASVAEALTNTPLESADNVQKFCDYTSRHLLKILNGGDSSVQPLQENLHVVVETFCKHELFPAKSWWNLFRNARTPQLASVMAQQAETPYGVDILTKRNAPTLGMILKNTVRDVLELASSHPAVSAASLSRVQKIVTTQDDLPDLEALVHLANNLKERKAQKSGMDHQPLDVHDFDTSVAAALKEVLAFIAAPDPSSTVMPGSPEVQKLPRQAQPNKERLIADAGAHIRLAESVVKALRLKYTRRAGALATQQQIEHEAPA